MARVGGPQARRWSLVSLTSVNLIGHAGLGRVLWPHKTSFFNTEGEIDRARAGTTS